MRATTVEQQIKDFVLNEAGMDKVGIASIDRFNQSPKGNHPTDFLPGCKSVIVFAIRVPDGAVNNIMRVFEDQTYDVQGVYGCFGYGGAPNYHLLWGNYKIARFVEKITGCIAMPETAGPTHGAKMMSMRHCAAAAGLGEFGWSSIMLTPEFGPRNRFGAVLTTAELKADPLYHGPKLCDPSKCHVCEHMCPTGAVPPYDPDQVRHIEMGDRSFEYGGTHWVKCRVMCHGTYGEYNPTGAELVPRDMENPVGSDLASAMGYYKDHPGHEWIQHNPTYKCGNCLAYCPVGNWRERFYDTGISHIDTTAFIDEGAPAACLPVGKLTQDAAGEAE